MKNFLNNKNRISALITILVLTVGSTSIVATTHVAKADLNGKQCVFFSCANNTITGGISSSNGGGGGGQPTPNTAKLIVIKKVGNRLDCPPGSNIQCKPSDFTITVSGVTASPSSFAGSDTPGTTVTVSPGTYTVSENQPAGAVGHSFSDDCKDNGDGTASGTISAGETQTCTITNGNP